ncbi:MAG: DUF948 domain-containing protein [Clostridium sp.]
MYITFRDMVLFLFLLCFIVLTVFLCITLYRLTKTLKSVNEVIEENRSDVNSSIKSLSTICGKTEGAAVKISDKISDEEFESYIPAYLPYITGAISFIVSVYNIFKSNKETK